MVVYGVLSPFVSASAVAGTIEVLVGLGAADVVVEVSCPGAVATATAVARVRAYGGSNSPPYHIWQCSHSGLIFLMPGGMASCGL